MAGDWADAIQFTLESLVSGQDLDPILRELAVSRPRDSTSLGAELLELAADAIEEAGASRSEPIDYEGIRERHLGEFTFRGRVQHHKSHYALTAAAMIRAGVRPDLDGEVAWWSRDDLYEFAFFALLAYLRVAAERTSRPVEVIVRSIAEKRGITLTMADLNE